MAPQSLVTFEICGCKFEVLWDNVKPTVNNPVHQIAQQYVQSQEGLDFLKKLEETVADIVSCPGLADQDILAKLSAFVKMPEEIKSKVVQWFKKIVLEWGKKPSGDSRKIVCCFETCSATSVLVDAHGNVLSKMSLDLTEQGAFLYWAKEDEMDTARFRVAGKIWPLKSLPNAEDYDVSLGDGRQGFLKASEDITRSLDQDVYVMQPNLILGKAKYDSSPPQPSTQAPSPAQPPSTPTLPPPKSLGEVFNSEFKFGKDFGRYLCEQLSSSHAPEFPDNTGSAPQVPDDSSVPPEKGQGTMADCGQGAQLDVEPMTGWKAGQYLTLPQGRIRVDAQDSEKLKIRPLELGEFTVQGSRVESHARTHKILCKNSGKKVRNGLALVTLDFTDEENTQVVLEKPLDKDGMMELVLDRSKMKQLFKLDVQTAEGDWIPTLTMDITGNAIADPDPVVIDEQDQDVVILIDTSGSMERVDPGHSKKRIEQVMDAALEVVNQTICPTEEGKASHRVAVMVWNSTQTWLSTHGADQLQWFDQSNVADLRSLISRQSADGYTYMDQALQKVIKDPDFSSVKHIELLCDGDVGALAEKTTWEAATKPFIERGVSCTLIAYGASANQAQLQSMCPPGHDTFATYKHKA